MDLNLNKALAAPEAGGYHYYVSDDQLAAFSKLTCYERLQWLDQVRVFSLFAETPVTSERRERLRRGERL